MRTLTNPRTGQQVTVPADMVTDYVSRGWVAPGAPIPVEPTPVEVPGEREADEPEGVAEVQD